MCKTPLRNFLSGMKQKKVIQRHPIIVTDTDYDHIMEIERSEKNEFERNVSVNSDEESH